MRVFLSFPLTPVQFASEEISYEKEGVDKIETKRGEGKRRVSGMLSEMRKCTDERTAGGFLLPVLAL